MKPLRLQSFRLKNFKAVRDSGVIQFTPLTVFIGNNGSGKSSIIEGLKTFQGIAEEELVDVMKGEGRHGYENVWYQGALRNLSISSKKGDSHKRHAYRMSFKLQGQYKHGSYTAEMEIGLGQEEHELLISREKITVEQKVELARDGRGHVKFEGELPTEFGTIQGDIRMEDGLSIIGAIPYLDELVSDWQFLYLDPGAMGEPAYQYGHNKKVQLNQDGANIAEYLADIGRIDPAAFTGILETLQYVIPYAQDLPPLRIDAIDRMFYLQMTEGEFKVPGWMLSTGTLRFLGILALLRHPKSPPLIIIEELENGLDPRTLSLIVDEMRNVLEAGKTQIIATTHSPYLLDLLHLSQIVLVERSNGQPQFTRPVDQKSLQEWSKKFSPGQLYTMDLLSHKGQ